MKQWNYSMTYNHASSVANHDNTVLAHDVQSVEIYTDTAFVCRVPYVENQSAKKVAWI